MQRSKARTKLKRTRNIASFSAASLLFDGCGDALDIDDATVMLPSAISSDLAKVERTTANSARPKLEGALAMVRLHNTLRLSGSSDGTIVAAAASGACVGG